MSRCPDVLAKDKKEKKNAGDSLSSATKFEPNPAFASPMPQRRKTRKQTTAPIHLLLAPRPPHSTVQPPPKVRTLTLIHPSPLLHSLTRRLAQSVRPPRVPLAERQSRENRRKKTHGKRHSMSIDREIPLLRHR
mmetsp:Transcript_16566/g.53949  ORF Transcript_16566/g.53949 Transcript_16566/m.53949 type:complete len:134 (+) Transcript_16566:183-584(+)